MKRLVRFAALALVAAFCAGAAQACGGVYTVREGDSLSLIADRLYKDASKWEVLHRDNRGLVGDDPDTLLAGVRLRLACIDGLPVDLFAATEPANPTSIAPAARRPSVSGGLINLVTAGDFAPFTDRTLEQGGMITDMMSAIMRQSGLGDTHRVNWINDRTAHVDPLMREGMMDMAFPSYRPDCAQSPSLEPCRTFLFSDPMFELLIVLFVDKTRPVPFAQDTDIEGKTLCRPVGYPLHDLDRADRRWVSDAKITLMQPVTVSDCFTMLMAGQVDAVAVNEFTGRDALHGLGLGDRVEVIGARPLSIETLHVVILKDHPEAAGLMATINNGLAEIRATGEFQRVIDRHLPAFWAQF